MERFIFISLLIVVVSGDPCPDTLPGLCANCTTYNEEMGINRIKWTVKLLYHLHLGCLFSDAREETKFDNYQEALDHCRFGNTGGICVSDFSDTLISRGLMGNNSILAEALNENQQNILVSLMKVQISSETYLVESSSNQMVSGSRKILHGPGVILLVEWTDQGRQ